MNLVALFFKRDSDMNVLDQLGKAFDERSVSASLKTIPDLFIVDKTTWLLLEQEISKLLKGKKVGYDEANIKVHDYYPNKDGYMSLIYRARPIITPDWAEELLA